MCVTSRRKVALFVDFDNAYSGLKRRSSDAAEEFGARPHTWLKWLEDGMPCSCAEGGAVDRSILVRKCYINPKVYGRYRSRFAMAGFSVVDCPELTGLGKTAADMLMVLEIMDALDQQLYDEFIIFSGDADFSPILLRLRARDRRTAVVVTGKFARIMHGVTDRLVDPKTFVRFGLRIEEEMPPAVPAVPTVELEAAAPAPAVAAATPAAATRPEPVRPRIASRSAEAAAKPLPAQTSSEDAISGEPGDEAAVIEFISEFVAGKETEVSLATLGGLIRKRFGSVVQTNWFGYKNFGKWLKNRLMNQGPLPFTIVDRDGGYVSMGAANAPATGTSRGEAAAPGPGRSRPAPGKPRPRTGGVVKPAEGEPVVRGATDSGFSAHVDTNPVETVAEPANSLMGQIGVPAALEPGAPPSGAPSVVPAWEIAVPPSADIGIPALETDAPASGALDSSVPDETVPELLDVRDASTPFIDIAETVAEGKFLEQADFSFEPEAPVGDVVEARTHCSLCEAALRPQHPRCIICGTLVEAV